jgi:hypothetical protein
MSKDQPAEKVDEETTLPESRIGNVDVDAETHGP